MGNYYRPKRIKQTIRFEIREELEEIQNSGHNDT